MPADFLTFVEGLVIGNYIALHFTLKADSVKAWKVLPLVLRRDKRRVRLIRTDERFHRNLLVTACSHSACWFSTLK